ncbi:MAG: flagellin FliC [Myxococcales bacterium]|nr:flagellin FliC [Myxococcales bacterium]
MSLSSMTLRTNVAALNAQRQMQINEGAMTKSMARLSSGLRINTASDDAAGLAISEKLRSQVRSLSQAQRNANDGISLLQAAEGALNEIGDMAVRMRELAMQSANGTLGDSERLSLHDEFTALRTEIDRIANVTQFNGIGLIDGTLSAGVTFQVGIENVAANDRITIALSGANSATIGLTGGMTLSTVDGARGALDLIDGAISAIASRRGDIGATQNRLQSTINNLAASHENLSAANSRIRDADIAAESANFARGQILMQSGVSILAQANQLPQLIAQLVG